MLQLPSAPVVSRLAPTPSGFLHLGNAVNFTLTWLLTRHTGGQLYLRIDDLDRARYRLAYLENIFRTLDWLGLDYDHGPSGPDDFERNFSQQHRVPEYEAVLQAARATHPGLFYSCSCSRTELARHALPDGRYPGTCRPAGLREAASGLAWRAQVPAAAEVAFIDLALGPLRLQPQLALGDFVARKKDGVAAYQVASVLDDVRLGITLIVRGQDLLPSTVAQQWLAPYLPGQAAFTATQFLHHGLVLNEAGEKLSKSTQAGHQRGVMEEASSPQVVYQAVAQLIGITRTRGNSLKALQDCVTVS